METLEGNYVPDRQELQDNWDEKRGIERDMDTTDGLGAELREVKKTERNETHVQDGNGHRLRVGDEVHVVGTPNYKQENFGVVTNISDPDGDAGPYGEPIAINPGVHVDFKDNTDETFDTRYIYDQGIYEVDDIEAI